MSSDDPPTRIKSLHLSTNSSSTTPSQTSSTSSHSSTLPGSRPTLAYILIRWLFRFVLGVFYSNVVVEGEEHITRDGMPTMLCANHSNSLTDALLLVTSVPPSKRSLLRLTAKDTQFHRGTFSSFLIENAGTLPIKRPKDHNGQKVDNSIVFEQLIKALEEKGDMICMFPEGVSRYHPEMAPLKQGVSRIISDTLTRVVRRTTSTPSTSSSPQHSSSSVTPSEFKLAIQTVSISYPQRNSFRSDVLVTFHPPIFISPSSHPDLIDLHPQPAQETPSKHEHAIRDLTSQIGRSIRSGILDAPSWEHLRAANTARRLYAPLGTRLTLGDHVRLTQRFVDALAGKRAERKWSEDEEEEEERVGQRKEKGLGGKRGKVEEVWKTPMREHREMNGGGGGYFGIQKSPEFSQSLNGRGAEDTVGMSADEEVDEVKELLKDLKTYQDLLYLHGIKDDRVRNPRLLRRRTLLKRLLIRSLTSAFLLMVAIPGSFLWLPVFGVTRYKVDQMVKKGPAWDTYDEIAQNKLVYGVGVGMLVLLLSTLFTFPFFPLNLILTPMIMWLTLRFLEDLTSSLRALVALLRLLLLGKRQLLMLRSMRDGLRERVEKLAVERAGLPRDASVFVARSEGRWTRRGLGRVAEGLGGWLGFFDPRRRRKKDWNESLKLFDQSEFAEDEKPSL